MTTPDLFGYMAPEKSWEQKYKEHLASRYWKDLSKLAFERAHDKCERCGFDKYTVNLAVHHLTYERFGHERLEDVEVVCAKKCHKIEDKRREKETEKRNYEKLQEARFDGWVRSVYGDDAAHMDEQYLREEYEAFLERIGDY